MENAVEFGILFNRAGDFTQQRFRFLNLLVRPDDPHAQLAIFSAGGVATVWAVCRETSSRIHASMIAAKNKFRFL